MHGVLARAVVVGVLLGGAARADSGWRKIRGRHVVLRTDLGSGAAREAALAVERFRAQIIAAGWPRATLPAVDRVEVTVFGNGLDFEHHFGRNLLGVFFHEVPPFAVVYGHPDKWERRATLATPETTSVLRHELVHHLAASIYRRQPRWFSEGLAQFLETVRTGEDGKTVVVGAANLDAMQKYRSFRSLRVADALAWWGLLDDMPEATMHGLYGLSWVMVHWLFNEHPEQFAQLQGLLARGIDPDKAWKVILPGLKTPDLDAAINQYVSHGNYQEYLAPFTDPRPPLEESPLTEADVHAERARVAMAAARSTSDRAGKQREAQEELATALKIDPADANALVLRFQLASTKDRPAIARQLTGLTPRMGGAGCCLEMRSAREEHPRARGRAPGRRWRCGPRTRTRERPRLVPPAAGEDGRRRTADHQGHPDRPVRSLPARHARRGPGDGRTLLGGRGQPGARPGRVARRHARGPPARLRRAARAVPDPVHLGWVGDSERGLRRSEPEAGAPRRGKPTARYGPGPGCGMSLPRWRARRSSSGTGKGRCSGPSSRPPSSS